MMHPAWHWMCVSRGPPWLLLAVPGLPVLHWNDDIVRQVILLRRGESAVFVSVFGH